VNTYDEHTPVLIIGGGYAGLTASLFLSHLGVESILVDRHPGVSIQGRARGINPRTMEIYRSLGIADEVNAAGAPFAGDLGGARCTTLADEWMWLFPPESPLMYPDISPSGFNLADQSAVEPALIASATDHGADQRRNTQMVSLEVDDDGVTAVTEDRASRRRRTIRADYLIAADGQRSAIREQLGIKRTGPGVVYNVMAMAFSADIARYVKRRAILWWIVNDTIGTGVLTTTADPERWSMAVAYDPQTQTPDDFPVERCVELVRGAIGDADLEVKIHDTTPWAQGVAVSNEYQRGRVFFAGDAAHVWSPAGGIGANTGIQDSYNLAWKLAGVVNGWADASLLDSYHAERHPLAMDLMRLTEERQAHRAGGDPEKDKTDDLLWSFGQRYWSDAIVDPDADTVFGETLDLHGQPGIRAPHLWVERDGERMSTHDLFSQSFVLFTGDRGEAWKRAAKRVAADTGIPLRAFGIGDDLTDVDGKWADSYTVGADGAVLIRPDGYVAWRHEGASGDPAADLSGALLAVVGR
jgi:2-polyprenyl-6-methoxyphenol hydroxylase-like FAD-dependent oxidoreductase